jgi:fructoselysine-6-P-deglycase FrlB-like protein
VLAQPDWLRRVPTDRRFPEDASLLFTGCGTSFHAAQTGGDAVQAFDLLLEPRRAEDTTLVVVSHEGETPASLEAAEAWPGPTWLVTGKPDSPLGRLSDEVVVATPAVEESWCHTASYTCAVTAIAALRGEDVAWIPDAVATALDGPRLPVSAHERYLVVGAGHAWITAQEAELKLREGCFVPAEAHHTEQLLHGYLAAVDESVRAFVLAPEGRAGERAADAAGALEELGAEVELLEAVHPVVDIVRFHLLVLDLAEARGVNPDRIRRDDERWARAAARAKL